MKNLVLIFVSTFLIISCSTEPETKEEVMQAYLEALAECDKETLIDLTSTQNPYGWEPFECEPYQTTVMEIHCETEGKKTSCCCEEEIQGAPYFNGSIRSRYGLVQEEGEWKVYMIYKESDLGRRGINICD